VNWKLQRGWSLSQSDLPQGNLLAGLVELAARLLELYLQVERSAAIRPSRHGGSALVGSASLPALHVELNGALCDLR
jgi:hypothetical protein